MGLYRKNYLCVCDGQQEKLYLEHVGKLISDFPRRVVKFNTLIDRPQRLEKSYEEYDSAALFDFDYNEGQFKTNIELCNRMHNTYKSTRKTGRCIYHAYTNVNFDLWLILHKQDFSRSVARNSAYVPEVKRLYSLSTRENIKAEATIRRILGQISLADVKQAVNRAENIRRGKLQEDGTVVGSTVCYPNPDFSLHEFMKVVLTDCGLL